jgi:signal transduction histidine kinase
MLIIMLFISICISGSVLADSIPEYELTNSEKIWLLNHSEIVLSPASNNYPFEFFDKNGTYRGMASDYIALLEKRLGVKFRVVRVEDENLRVSKVKSEGVDIIAAVAMDEGIRKSMLLTRPHIVMPGVIVAKKKYKNINALHGKKIAVVTGTQWEKFIATKYPDIELVRVPDVTTGLKLVSLGPVSGFVSDIATSSYYIHREGFTDLKISGSVGKNYELAIAMRNDWPKLHSIFEKMLASISDDEREKIFRQWIHLKEPSLLEVPFYRNIIMSVFITIFLGLISIVIWNLTLKSKVLKRTQELNKELQLRYEAEVELQEAHNNLINSHQELQCTQLKLIHAAKMESIGLLAVSVAHEVKNPLAVIRLGLDYIGSEFKKKSSISEVLKDMDDSISSAASIINRLLDFSRIDELESSNADLNEIIEDALHLVEHELKRSNIKLVKQLDSQLSQTNLDANKVKQVFVNLFMNAIQAMGKDGVLTIATYQTDIGENSKLDKIEQIPVEAGDTMLVAEVNDTGPGVNEEMVDKIFEPFYTTKQVGEGVGLGLSIIRNIMDLHSGAIDVINCESGGLSVRVFFKKT